MTTFYVTKRTGTYADALVACGLAGLLSQAGAPGVSIRDEGWGYSVDSPLPNGVDSLKFEPLRNSPGYRYVKLREGDDPDAPGADVINYPDERERLKRFREQRGLLRKPGARLTEDQQEQLKAIAPMHGWFLYQNFNVLQAFGGYNGLHAAIRNSKPDAFARSVASNLRALETNGDRPTTDFEPKVAAVQAFNPSVGKGINRTKPSGTTAAGLPPAFVDWFDEWLRFVGAGRSAYALSVGKDIKVLAIAPENIELEKLEELWNCLVTLATPWSSVTIDITMSLGLARFMVVRSGLIEGELADSPFALLGKTPADLVSGLQTAYFTSLGNARALTNTSFIGLPGWFPVDAENAGVWLEILEEHRHVISGLDEDKSEELRLLQLYRDFLSARTAGLPPLLQMLASYAAHLLRAREQKNRRTPVWQFTAPLLRRLVEEMEPTYARVFENDGFRNIATALRRATVGEQYQKSQGRQQFEIRYGLFQDLERKARFKGDFLMAISKFIMDYDLENARFEEKLTRDGRAAGNVRRRPRVTTHDLANLTQLMDDMGAESKSEVVAMLLLAYASARDPREPGAARAPEAATVDDTIEPLGDSPVEDDQVERAE